jgi:hypothetical protein
MRLKGYPVILQEPKIKIRQGKKQPLARLCITDDKKDNQSEAESKEKQRVWDPRPELTITSTYVDSYTCTMDNHDRVGLNHMSESTLSPSQGLRIWPLA